MQALTATLALALAAGGATASGVVDVPITATLLNKSATLAALPVVNATVSKLLGNSADAASAVDQALGVPSSVLRAKGAVTPTATSAPLGLSVLGGKCGAGVAACLHGCCAQWGECALSSQACGPLCQKPYSAPMAPCAGDPSSAAPPDPATLPTVGLGAPCGAYFAKCASGLCCGQLNYCAADASLACALSSCDLAASPGSRSCAAVHKAAKPVTRRFKWVATWGTASPDGFATPTVFINKKWPAPTIFANAGDRIIVEFVNLIGQPSTIHWHGLKQVTTNIMDGVDPVTQVGVPGVTLGRRLAQVAGAGANVTDPPPPSFVYDFIAEAGGAYWWHDHSSALTYVDGLRGALIVADPASGAAGVGSGGTPAAVFEHEPVIFITDQYHALASDLLTQYINPANSDGVEPVPKSFAINGLAGVKTPWCGGADQPPCRSSVVAAGPLASCDAPNTRLKFVSGAAFAFVVVHIDGPATPHLQAALTMLDGIPIATPRPVALRPDDPLILYPGQRATVQLCATDPAAVAASPDARIVVRAPLNQFGTVTPNSNGLGLDGPGSIVDRAEAVLSLGAPYDGATADGVPLPSPGSLALPFNGPAPASQALSGVISTLAAGVPAPVDDFGPPPPATVTVPILLSTGFLSSTSAQYFYFNNITFAPAQSPALLAQDASPSGLPPNAAPNTAGLNVLSFKYGDVVDFVIYNTDTGDHPLHLHGQSFWIMAAGPPNAGAYDPAQTALTPVAARDVAAVQKGSYLVIRWVASHADLWFFHCHIEWHLADGLALVVKTTA